MSQRTVAMKKIYAKLIVIVLQLALALSVVAMSSYAWLVLSANPAVEGIQITIGGGNTILVAADLTETAPDGTVYHYPARFQDTLNFSQHKSYEYLNGLGELTPVSTADGLNWYLPAYYDLTDQEVQNGEKMAGDLKPIQKFILDDSLKHANLTGEEAKLAAAGSYAYLDFWVVSPGSEYTLRLSTGEDSGGSSVIGLMDVAETADGGYALTEGAGTAENAVRVGLLVNPDDIIDNTMVYYQSSPAYSGQYTRLKGLYMEPEKSYVYSSGYRFTIYEPNGDSHVDEELDGSYVVTQPVGLVNGTVGQVDIKDRLTVQTASTWLMAENGTETQIAQRFQAALAGFPEGLTTGEMAAKFYNEYLGGQLSPYISKGQFYKSTGNLYNAVSVGMDLGEDHTAGATDDVYIVKLEKDVPQRIRLFIWLEGQDVDCANSAAASSISLRLELAGSNAEPKTDSGTAAAGENTTANHEENDLENGLE